MIQKLAERISELSKLEPGWFDGSGVALSSDGLKWLKESFENKYDHDLPFPYLYPTIDGGVQVEWTINDWEISLKIDIDAKNSEFHALNKSGKEISEGINMSKEGWEIINKYIKSFSQ